MPIPLIFGALAGLQALEGAVNMFSSQDKLDELHKQQFPLLSEAPETRNARLAAAEAAKRGFTAQETGAYNQQLARSQNTGYQRTMNTAPGLAGAVLAGINYTNVAGQNDLALKDAGLHRQNIQYADKLTQNYQNILNANIATQQRNRIMAEQSLGKAVSDSRSRLMGAGNTLIAGMGYDQNQEYLNRMSGHVGGVSSGMGSKLFSTPSDAPSLPTYPFGGSQTQFPATGDYRTRDNYDWHSLSPVLGQSSAPYRQPNIPFEEYNNFSGQ